MSTPSLGWNGRTRLVFEVVAILVALLLGFTTRAFYFGSEMQKLKTHLEDVSRHEDTRQKTERIDSRVKLHLQPLLVELKAINARLDRME